MVLGYNSQNLELLVVFDLALLVRSTLGEGNRERFGVCHVKVRKADFPAFLGPNESILRPNPNNNLLLLFVRIP